MKKKYFKSAIGIGVGIVLLTVAVFANYESAGGYSTCKNALKKVAFAENVSVDLSVEATLDKNAYLKTYEGIRLNVGGNPSIKTMTTTEYRNGAVSTYTQTLQDGMRISQYTNADGTADGNIRSDKMPAQSISENAFGDKESAEKWIGFGETLADALVGDLKNCVVLISDADGIKQYRINLSTDQLPAYVKSGVSLFTSQIRKYNEDLIYAEDADPIYVLFEKDEPYFQNINALMSVDDKGNPVQIKAIVSIVGFDTDGREHVLEVNVNADFYDHGSTEIEPVSAEEIEMLEDMRMEYDEKTVTSFPENIIPEAASIGIIGGADGPTAVYVD